MAIQVTWHDEQHSLLLWHYEADWNWDDFHAAFEQSVEMGKTYHHRIDVINDLSGTTRMPPEALMHFHRLTRQMPPTVRLVYICGATTLTNTLIQLFGKIYHQTTWRTASSVADALQQITADRAKQESAER
jgi:hypothetical protein